MKGVVVLWSWHILVSCRHCPPVYLVPSSRKPFGSGIYHLAGKYCLNFTTLHCINKATASILLYRTRRAEMEESRLQMILCKKITSKGTKYLPLNCVMCESFVLRHRFQKWWSKIWYLMTVCAGGCVNRVRQYWFEVQAAMVLKKSQWSNCSCRNCRLVTIKREVRLIFGMTTLFERGSKLMSFIYVSRFFIKR